VSATRWINSSYSSNNGECVEVAWFKSSYSSNNGNCVEVAVDVDSVATRDSKDPEGGVLTLSPAAFRSFLTEVTRY
jgi:hypothetical protein